ncbi:MAG: carboxypeptidase-like regulatory domain-containing protein [Bacteroidales bacterium]|nr:carboxypeptidase-like regulatory domain-containing protein [Bacteroidales bacterium]MDD3906732.1 carboxypeptidase-like regulatory domain-containing protein [Bacteroidales bacterium]MDD4711909.1 carboxypeptidase-like regulatory domain-containing protein [Bacteroidales bacterium]
MKRSTFCFCLLGLLTSFKTIAQTTDASTFETALRQWVNTSKSDATSAVAEEPKVQDRNQSFLLRGRILDSETGQPLSYATVSVNQLGIGTASNQDGDWSLRIPANGTNGKLSVCFMGYMTKNLNIADLSEVSTIRLNPSHFDLAEVVVVPRDFIAELLAKAYKAIPENYPTKPTLCDGFYRETQRVNDSLFLCFDEAVLNVYKNTYKNARNFGQIRIEKSRKNVFPGIDSINDVRFYGGPHFPNDLDIVFSRWDFIKPSEYKNWVYELAGVYKDSLSSVYTISFKNRKAPNSNFQGRMFIDRDNLAYVGFELKRAGLSVFTQEQIQSGVSYLPGNTNIKIGYTEKDGKYFLSYITYKTNGVNTASKTRIYKDIEYVTTSIKTDSVSPIPFNQQFDYTDILSIKADNYDQTYWKDYNILQESNIMSTQTNLLYKQDAAMQQLTKVYNKELTNQEKTLLFLKRFTFDGGFAFLPINYKGGSHHIAYGIDNGNADISVPSKYFGISTMDGIRFELNKQYTLFSTISAALYGVDQIQFDLGMSYRFSLFPSGRWFFLDLGLAASTVNTKVDICSITNTNENLQIDGKTFDSEKINVKAGKSGFGVKPVIGLAVRMGKRYELFMDGSYFLPFLFKREYVQFKEAEGGFFSKKSAKVDWDDPNLFFYVNNMQMTTPRFDVEPYQFRIGIRSGF